jgi:hypothetical protein
MFSRNSKEKFKKAVSTMTAMDNGTISISYLSIAGKFGMDTLWTLLPLALWTLFC